MEIPMEILSHHRNYRQTYHRKMEINGDGGDTYNNNTLRGIEDVENNISIPIPQKVMLTIKEASAYSNIGINKIDKMLRMPNCPFAFYVGAKKLVKRKEFEKYISDRTTI